MDGSILHLHITNKRVLHRFQHCAASDDQELYSVECVAFCRGKNSPNWAASGGGDGFLKVWDLSSGILRISCPHNNMGVVALSWHASILHWVVTAALDNLLRVWDVRDGNYSAMISLL